MARRFVAVSEVDRIRAEYASRELRLPADLYSITDQRNLFLIQQKNRVMLRQLVDHKLTPLDDKAILDVGCGDGHHLLEFVTWGARRERLAGIDLLENRVAQAIGRIGSGSGPDLRAGDASNLPWRDESFDIVHQGTVFTSILDADMKRRVAREMLRVLKHDGAVVWYDFRVNNPRNPNVRGVGADEIRALFPGCDVRLTPVTLAPPIARRLVPLSWMAALALEKLSMLNTHYLGVIRKTAARP